MTESDKEMAHQYFARIELCIGECNQALMRMRKELELCDQIDLETLERIVENAQRIERYSRFAWMRTRNDRS